MKEATPDRASHLIAAFRAIAPELRDERVRELLDIPLAEGYGGQMIQLDFNARLVTALRAEKLWPAR